MSKRILSIFCRSTDIRLKFVRLGREAERLQADIFLKAGVSTAGRVYAPNVDGLVV